MRALAILAFVFLMARNVLRGRHPLADDDDVPPTLRPEEEE